MLCPVCAVELTMSDRQGIEIDYCPKCRGVWLDRGELDKIIERSGAVAAPPPPAPIAPDSPRDTPRDTPRDPYREPPRDAYREPPRERRYRDDDDDDDYKRKRRKNWLEELFD